MIKETYLRICDLERRKRKNEEAVPMELLTTKYKVPYDKLCEDLRENRKQLRLQYIEAIRILSDFAAESVYYDLESDEERAKFFSKFDEIRRGADEVTVALLNSFVLTINRYAYEGRENNGKS